MSQQRRYKTKQRDLILQTMQAAPSSHFTAEALAASLRDAGEELGLATIYRNLDKLVGEGLVLKYTLPGGQRACYQYTGGCAVAAAHFHLICTSCGSMQHLECAEVDALASHLMSGHRFCLDKQNTVLYGMCRLCAPDAELPAPPACGHTCCNS